MTVAWFVTIKAMVTCVTCDGQGVNSGEGCWRDSSGQVVTVMEGEAPPVSTAAANA